MRGSAFLAGLTAALMMTFAAACADDAAAPTQNGETDGAGTQSAGASPTPDATPIPLETPDLRQYFQRIEEIFADADEATEAADAKLTADMESAADFEAQVTAIQVFLGSLIDIFSESIGAMDVIQPPAEAAAAHEAFIEATTNAAVAASNYQARLQFVESAEQAEQLSAEFDEELAGLVAAADAACAQLQGVAAQNAIEVQLTCE